MKCIQKSIGVDVSKLKLDIFIKGQTVGNCDISKEVPNSPAGFRVIRDLAIKYGATVCCEPTGGYEHWLVEYMLKAKIPVAYTPGHLVRYYAKSQGKHYKNDKIDAKMIAEYAEHSELRLITPKDALVDRLCRKMRLYNSFIESCRKLSGLLESEYDPDSKKLLAHELKHSRQVAAKLLAECEEIVKSNPQLDNLVSRICMIKGVAMLTAISVISELPELGQLSDSKLFAMAGLAPLEKQSGNMEWQRKIYGGRKRVRNALYMSAISGIAYNPIFRAYYRRKRDEGHPAKWCIVPVMRKLLSLMNSIARKPEFTPIETPIVRRK